ncbi:hypothetical protein B9Z19DRAFT_413106 [Tuber borchii]|uniref:Uncharacterized protein n=1 Tax=Tuber borchii TaxID=42251 RepID=A0A2T6ZGS9_TUBBO|nr:hypothetical protein B9Z19DRAFT_413106 [Tuber borchii]
MSNGSSLPGLFWCLFSKQRSGSTMAPLLFLFSDTKDRNSPCFAVGSYHPQCRPDIYLRGGVEAGSIVIANAGAEMHSCSTYSNRHTTVRIKALGIARCSQAVLSRQSCHFRCEQGIEAIELEMRSIVCARSEGCKALLRVPGGLALYVVMNCGTK